MSDQTTIEIETDDDTPRKDRPSPSPLTIELSDEKRDEILNYLLQELETSKSERAERVKKWMKWRQQREAQPETTAAEHALSNASRIMPPLTQIHAQTAYAKVKGYYDTGKPFFWQLKSYADTQESHDDAKFMTKYLGILAYSQTDLNMPKIKRIVSDEATFMGLLMVKVVWDTLEWKFKGDDGQTKTMTYHDGPAIIPISQEDTYYPPFWDEIQRMPWIAHELHLPLHEFQNKVEQGIYDEPKTADGKEIDPKTWERENLNESEQANAKLRYLAPGSPKVIDFMEFHFFWDIDDDGVWEDVIFTVHTPSRTILRKVFNGIAAREFQEFGYIPRSFMLESRGIGQICEGLQDEASGTHRLRNDGMKLASIKMLAVRRAVLRENKNTIYQGKVWITDNPKEDMEPIALGEVPASSLQSENLVWSLAAQATGVSSPDRGFADPTLGTRDTFRGQEMRMQASQGIMATTIESTSESWSRVGLLVVFQLVRNRERVIWNERQLGRLTDEEISQLDRILNMDVSDIPRRFKFDIYTTDIEHSYEARRETLIQLMELTFQAQPQLVQLSQAVFGPQGMQLKQVAPDAWSQLLEIYVGSVNLLKESYHFADFDDTENYLQDVKKWEKVIQMLRAVNAQQMSALDAARNQMGGANGGNPGGQAGVPVAPNVAGPAGAGQPGVQGAVAGAPQVGGVGSGPAG